jgi:redox-sensitive bicupin YhaK (pirin superfamily)
MLRGVFVSDDSSIDMTAIAHLIDPRNHDLGGGFVVRRALPHMHARSVGPFVFFDHFGPIGLPAGSATDVRPHPHIGLATVTYLFEGAMVHRDSLGSLQEIRPGDVNWMTAGSGIVHSERGTDYAHAHGQRLHGVQTWVALPREHEETAPSFRHYPGDMLPRANREGARVHVMVGNAFGVESPVAVLMPTLYAAIELDAGATLAIDADYPERAVYVVEGSVALDEETVRPTQLAVLAPGAATLRANMPSRVMLVGGAALPEPRFMWWNFVSTSRERIEQAKEDWRAQRMGHVPGETEFIPLPDR